MSNFTTWRSLVDGEEIGAIPDSGLDHRYIADDIDSSDGDTIDSWSPSEGDLTLNAVGGPIYRSNGIGGNPSVEFDGVDDLFQSSGDSIPQPTHIFVVAKFNDSSGIQNIFDGESADGRQIIQANSGGYRIFAGSDTVGGGSVDTDPHIYTASFDAENSYLRVDGDQILSGDPGNDGLSMLTLGASNSESDHFEGEISEWLVYSDDKGGEEDDIEELLAQEYGISL